jgi:beta-lactamase regulating signal transducer with metallopeptidase domain
MIPSQFVPVANHLWQSTLFAGIAGLLTLFLKKNRAQVRYWLWFSASIKFLIPFSLLVALGGLVGRHTAPAIAPSSLVSAADFSSVLEQAGLRAGAPFTVTAPRATMLAVQHSYPTLIVTISLLVWAIGFLILIFRWTLRWRRVSASVRHATLLDIPISLPPGLPVRSSPAFGEPGVFGVIRPVLLLPEGLLDRLTAREMEAILAHELCHVRRRDNLASAIHMAVEALFWFHPLVWWLEARLLEERERACDEEVLRNGGEPRVYAEGILKICELYLASPLACLSGVTGGDLTRRIDEILSNRVAHPLDYAKKVTLALAGLAAFAVPVAVGVIQSPAMLAQSQPAAVATYTIEAKLGGDFRIFIPVRINGAGPLWCGFDTGSGHVLSLTSDLAKKYGLSPTETGQTVGAGPTAVDDKRVTGATLGIGRLEIPNRTVVIHDDPSSSCLFGAEILADFAIEVDYQTPAIRLYTASSFKARPQATAIPVTFDHGNPLIHAHLLLRPGEEADANLMLNTGLPQWPVALFKRFSDDQRILSRARKVVEPAVQATGTGGAIPILVTHGDSVAVGPFSNPNPVMVLLRSESASAMVNGWDGQLGGEFLRRFTLTIDYPNQRLFLEPNRRFGLPPQPFDGSGLLIRGEPGNFVIRKVLPASAGAAAGLQEGDILLSLDGLAAADLTLPMIHEKMYRSAGKCAFRVRRGDHEIDAVVELASQLE